MAELESIEIPSEEIRLVLNELSEKTLKTTNNQLLVSLASKSGTNNFIGIVYRVTFSKNDEKAIEKRPMPSVIVKVAPRQSERRQRFQIRSLFLREIFMYEQVSTIGDKSKTFHSHAIIPFLKLQVLPFFRQFERSKGVAMNGFIEYPMCHRTIDDNFSECLILEDLNVCGFKMIDRFTEDVTANHVRLVMQTLGKFHAISFAVQDQQPKKFIELASNLNELYIRKDDKQLRAYFNMMANSILDALSSDEDAFVRSKLTKLLERDAIDIAADCIDTKSFSSTAITHADAWQENIAFKYDENGKPIEAGLLDWQMARVSSPVLDIVYCIFCCTTKELRDEHYDEFLEAYHQSLTLHIRKYVEIHSAKLWFQI